MNCKYVVSLACLFLILAACAPTPTYQPAIEWTLQPIELAVNLREGMSEDEVVKIMGQPIAREFQTNGTALQWCKTARTMQFPLDRYVIGFFYKGRLVGTRNYQGAPGVIGDCAAFYRQIEWRPSDGVIEYRFR